MLALGWTLAYVRTVAVGAAIAAPLFAYVVGRALAGRSPTLARSPGRHRRESLLIITSAVASLVLALVLLPPVNRAAARMPLALDPKLDALPPGTVVMNEYGYGGWLRYAHPDLVPAIDERTEVFSLHYVQAYLDARLTKPGWGNFLLQTKASAALVPTDSPIADALVHERKWRSVGESEGLSLLVSTTP